MTNKATDVIICRQVNKLFPVYNEKNRWQLLFGKAFKGIQIKALTNISLAVPKGQFVGILGRNGAGKTTLLRVLGGVYSPSSGVVKISGPLTSLFELGGFGHRYITGREYASRILKLQGVKKNYLAILIEEIKVFSELGDSFESTINTYSSGMCARLYFSVATAKPESIYIIDEILSVGDEHFQAKCWHRLCERFSQGASGILVTHDWSAVIKLCAQAHILSKGSIITSGATDKVVQSYLNLPLPEKKFAKFDDELPLQYVVHTKANMSIPIEIELMLDKPVEFSFTIEKLSLGKGWETVILNHCGIVAIKKGKYQLILEIPHLPLPAGDYLLNLFLNTPQTEMQPKMTHDVKSWTFGNAIGLSVEGPIGDEGSYLDFDWCESVL